jgi:hypothetical protein
LVAIVVALLALGGAYFYFGPLESTLGVKTMSAQEKINSGGEVSRLVFAPGGSLEYVYTSERLGKGCTVYQYSADHLTGKDTWLAEILPNGENISCPLV